MKNGAFTDQTALFKSSLIRVYTVCTDSSIPLFTVLPYIVSRILSGRDRVSSVPKKTLACHMARQSDDFVFNCLGNVGLKSNQPTLKFD